MKDVDTRTGAVVEAALASTRAYLEFLEAEDRGIERHRITRLGSGPGDPGVIEGELFVSARRAFQDPDKWGEVLAEIADRLGAIYAAEMSGLSNKDVAVRIAEAFVAEMGAKPVKRAAAEAKAKKSAVKKKPAVKRKKR